jgi:hypothetical protein
MHDCRPANPVAVAQRAESQSAVAGSAGPGAQRGSGAAAAAAVRCVCGICWVAGVHRAAVPSPRSPQEKAFAAARPGADRQTHSTRLRGSAR